MSNPKHTELRSIYDYYWEAVLARGYSVVQNTVTREILSAVGAQEIKL